jgi:predicted HTH transcriptional regulator
MSLTHIQQLLLAGESDTLDFKQTISSATKIAKTMSAFANHKGGTLLVGVTDKKMICGIKSEDEKYMLDLAVRFYCKPEIGIEIIEWEIGNKVILEAKIPEGENKPYYAKDDTGKWWVHVRVKDKSLLASKVVVDVLKRQHSLQGVVIRYSDKERDLLKYIETKGKITLKDACKLLNISRWRAQKMLVNLVSVGVIQSHTNEKTEFFTLC